jgi:hypothetical protein
MDMNLVTDLSNELAIAFIVERKHSHKLAAREAVTLIDRVTTELEHVVSDAVAAGRAPFERRADNDLIH